MYKINFLCTYPIPQLAFVKKNLEICCLCVIEEEGFERLFGSPCIVQGTVRCTGLDKNRFFSSFFGGLECIGLSFALSPIYDI